MIKSKNLVAIAMILLSVTICAANNENVPSAASGKNTNKTTELTEGQAYKLLYDNQVKANDAVLKTIFYALGGLGTALILVFASNWWFNEKKVKDLINEIDKKVKDLNKDVLAEMTEKISKFSTETTAEIYQAQTKLKDTSAESVKELTLKFTDFTDKIRAEIKEDDKNLLSNFQKQLEGFNENYRQQISSINDNANSLSHNLKEIIDSKDEAIKALLENEKKSLSYDLDSIKGDLYRAKYYMWQNQGVYRNALMSQIDEIEVKTKMKFGNLDFYLDQISQTVSNMKELRKSDKDISIRILKEVPEINHKQANELIDKIIALEDKSE
jgi:hypothetical protein